jgi:RNA polymerase sigma factor (sigma-70 family)
MQALSGEFFPEMVDPIGIRMEFAGAGCDATNQIRDQKPVFLIGRNPALRINAFFFSILVTLVTFGTTKKRILMNKGTVWTDQEILAALSGSNQVNEAIQQLYQGYYGILENYIVQNSGTEADAADTIQETLLVFLNMVQTGKFRGDSSINSVLYGINRNIWLTTLRKTKSRVNRDQTYTSEQERKVKDISQTLEEMEGYQLVMSLFERLGKKCQRLLYLFYYENLSMKEIGEEEGYTNEQVVRNTKYKCMKQLIDRIEDNPNLYQLVKNALENGKEIR